MQPIFISGQSLTVYPGRIVEPLAEGVRVASGGHGYALYGPYLNLERGVYRVTVDANIVQKSDLGSVFDVYSHGRIWLSRHFRAPFAVVAHFETTTALELRFQTAGQAVDVRSVSLQPLWLDAGTTSPTAVTDLLKELAEEDIQPGAVIALCDALAEMGEIDQADDLRRQILASAPAARVARAWGRVHRGSLSSDDDASPTVAQVAPAAAAEAITTFDLFALTAEDRAKLAAHGYNPDCMEATRRHRAYSAPPRPWQSLGAAKLRAASAALLESVADTDLSFQYALAAGQGITAYCPISGEELRSQHGFLIHYAGVCFIFYRFISAEVFYLCTGEACGGKSFIYLPKSSIIIQMMRPTLRWYPKVELIYQLHLEVLSRERAATKYISRPTQVACVVSNNNMGHFIWNELSGIHYALSVGLGNRIQTFVALPSTYLPLGSVFRELDASLLCESTPKRAYDTLLDSGLLPVRFTDAIFSAEFADRLRCAAEACATVETPAADTVRPLLWVNLRAHTKVWIEQAAGYATILNAVYNEYGAASVLLDGWADCRAFAEEIRIQLHPEVVVYDGLNLPLFDSINWAFAVDAYVCTIGSGLVLLTWIAGKEGVAHAERAHMEQLTWWSGVRPDAPAPRSPPLEAITDVGAGPLGTGLYCDYHLDAAAILTPLLEILDQKFPRRPQSSRIAAAEATALEDPALSAKSTQKKWWRRP